MYTVMIDDNFDYMNEDARTTVGSFDDWDTALAACKGIVDQFLYRNHEEGMTADDLLTQFKSFGPDPFVVPCPEGESFSAWTYAEMRCADICA